MSQVYWRRNMNGRATFSLFFRGYPPNRTFYIACGVNQAIHFLENFRFSDHDMSRLEESGKFAIGFLEHLADLRFQGDVRAMTEGTIAFADEPIIEATAPLIQAQLVETMLLNIVTSASLFATKAARVVKAAGTRAVVDFGSRRAHSSESAIIAARAAYIAGFEGTSNVEAATMFGIPEVGTMAHSYVQAFPEESEAFNAYASEFPDSTTLLVDTYDVLGGIKSAIDAGVSLRNRGKALAAIRLDSGDLDNWSRVARQMLDDAGLARTRIVASGGLDEHSIAELTANNAPIDVFGVGTRFTTSADAPYIDSVYKLVELDGEPVQKTSEGKSTLPWAKQVYRVIDDETMQRDIITRAASPLPEEPCFPLLSSTMRNGKRVKESRELETTREFVSTQLSRLDDRHQRLIDPEPYPVEIAPDIVLRT